MPCADDPAVCRQRSAAFIAVWSENRFRASRVLGASGHALESLPKRVGNPDPVGHCASHVPYFAWKPPSTFRIWPVTKLASSDSSQQIAFATSSGLPRRFIGCMAEIDASL